MKALIAYFSRIGENLQNDEIIVLDKGNTEVVAEKIQALTGGDLYKIEEADAYPSTYVACLNRARREEENNEHPKLKDVIGIEMKQYDVIYLGWPIWYRSYPRVVAEFIDKYDFSGKIIKPFCTNDEGAFGISLLELNGQAKGAKVLTGLALKGSKVYESDEKIKDFVEAA